MVFRDTKKSIKMKNKVTEFMVLEDLMSAFIFSLFFKFPTERLLNIYSLSMSNHSRFDLD